MSAVRDELDPGVAGLWPVRLERPPEPTFDGEPLWHQPGRALWVATGLALQTWWFTAEREDLPAGVLDVPTDVWPLEPDPRTATGDVAAAAWLGGWTTAASVVEQLTLERGMPLAAELNASSPPFLVADYPPGLLRAAASAPDPVQRGLASMHPNCPPATLSVLAADEDFSVRRTAAAHLNVPADALAVLAGDEDASVRAAAAANRACPPDLLALLAADPDPQVLAAVAAHPRTPPPVLRRLAVEGVDASTREAAFTNPNLAAGDYAELAPRFGEYVAARSRHCPNPSYLDPGDPRFPVERSAVNLRHEPRYPNDVREPPFNRSPDVELGASRHLREKEWARVDEELDALIRSRPDLPPDVLQHLFGEAMRWRAFGWMRAVIDHPNAPRHLLHLLLDAEVVARAEAARPDMSWLPARLRGANLPAVLVWAMTLAANPHTPPELLIDLASHPDAGVQQRLAANPACPRQVTAELVSHPDDLTRAHLAHRLLPGDGLLDRLQIRDLTPRKLALHLASDVRVTHRLLPDVLLLVAASTGPVGPAREAAVSALS